MSALRKLAERFDDEVRFFRGWMSNAKTVGSIVPTSSITSRRMASIADPHSGLPVLELGPGTGVITKAILERGVKPENLVSIEYSADFVEHLRNNYVGVNVIHGDAFNLDETLGELRDTTFDCVVSGVPLLNFPVEQRVRYVEGILKRLPAGRPIVQLTYGPRSPVPPGRGDYNVTRFDFILRNIPPTTLWLYSRGAPVLPKGTPAGWAEPKMVPRILIFAGSLRTGAYSRKTADIAQKELALAGAEVTRISLADFPLPLMDEDLEREKGVPSNAVKLARMFADHDAVLICTPEYNSSIPPLVKNTIDWISRVKADGSGPIRAFPGKVMAICSSSNGHFAGIRSASHLRQVLSHIQAEVIAPQVSVPDGAQAFDEDGNFCEERLLKGMKRLAQTLVERARLLSTRIEPWIDVRDRLIVGLDLPTIADAENAVAAIGGTASFYKIGYQLAFAGGLELARDLVKDGKKVFLDLKLLDIDNTVAKGVESILKLGASMLTIHAYPRAMRAAVEAARGSPLTLLAVTVLTSMDETDMVDAGYEYDPHTLVLKRSEQALSCGMGGIVCSAAEAAAVRKIVGSRMAVVTPGIRPKGADHGDQKRVMTPADALAAGASHLVVARPIVGSPDRAGATRAILEEMRAAA